MAKKRKKSQIKGAAPWMVTMGDMNNLLMCFFIVMMGDISVTTQQEFYLTLTSFRGSLGFMSGGQSLVKGELPAMGHNVMALPSTERRSSMSRALKNLAEAFKPEIQTKHVRVMEDERGLVITLTGDLFFEGASAVIKDEVKPILHKVARIVRKLPNYIRIEGHTDNTVITLKRSKEGFRSNWELSSARSLNVLHYLIDEDGLDPKKLSAVAFGEYRPLDDNDTPEGRSFNRRVDIVVLRDKIIEKSRSKEISRPLPDEEWQ